MVSQCFIDSFRRDFFVRLEAAPPASDGSRSNFFQAARGPATGDAACFLIAAAIPSTAWRARFAVSPTRIGRQVRLLTASDAGGFDKARIRVDEPASPFDVLRLTLRIQSSRGSGSRSTPRKPSSEEIDRGFDFLGYHREPNRTRHCGQDPRGLSRACEPALRARAGRVSSGFPAWPARSPLGKVGAQRPRRHRDPRSPR